MNSGFLQMIFLKLREKKVTGTERACHFFIRVTVSFYGRFSKL